MFWVWCDISHGELVDGADLRLGLGRHGRSHRRDENWLGEPFLQSSQGHMWTRQDIRTVSAHLWPLFSWPLTSTPEPAGRWGRVWRNLSRYYLTCDKNCETFCGTRKKLHQKKLQEKKKLPHFFSIVFFLHKTLPNYSTQRLTCHAACKSLDAIQSITNTLAIPATNSLMLDAGVSSSESIHVLHHFMRHSYLTYSPLLYSTWEIFLLISSKLWDSWPAHFSQRMYVCVCNGIIEILLSYLITLPEEQHTKKYFYFSERVVKKWSFLLTRPPISVPNFRTIRVNACVCYMSACVNFYPMFPQNITY